MKRIFSVIAMLSMSTMAVAGPDLPWQKGKGKKPSKVGRPSPDKGSNGSSACAQSFGGLAYTKLAQEMSRLSGDQRVRSILGKYDLDITNVSWQDTGRTHNSAGGTNISDVRLVALANDARGKEMTITQPIIRLGNFEDQTVDVNMDEVFIPVGNAWGAEDNFAVSLREFLENLPDFLSWREDLPNNLFAERDRQVLVSAQASIMPVPQGGKAYFVPSIYNYQSTPEHPAVMTIVVSNEGTSVTVIDNSRDKIDGTDGMWGSGQLLFHNSNGEKSPFTLEALKAVTQTKEGQQRVEDLKNSGQAIAGQSGVNQVMMIQIPLKHPNRGFGGGDFLEGALMMPLAATAKGVSRAGLDTGVVGVADFTMGKFIELAGKGSKLERDQDLPIRVDVVYYMASDTTQLTGQEVESLPELLRGVYENGENLGSLVTGDDRTRLTRSYRPWHYNWWRPILRPYPWIKPYGERPSEFFEQHYGPTWMYRFANEGLAKKTMAELDAKIKAEEAAE